MPRKGEPITLSLLPHQKAELERLALQHGATWGGKPNISELVRMIADGAIALHKPETPHHSDRTHYESQLLVIETAIANLRKM